jgi:hypothetical protein
MEWSVVITELEAAGLSQKEIAAEAGCSQPYVSQLKTGRRSRCRDFEIGRRLVELHQRKRPDRYPENAVGEPADEKAA